MKEEKGESTHKLDCEYTSNSGIIRKRRNQSAVDSNVRGERGNRWKNIQTSHLKIDPAVATIQQKICNT